MEKQEQMLAAASMYYLQDLKMEAIAARLHLSRSSVSRLLKEARARGLVEITLRSPPTAAPEVGRRIQDAFGITTHVVPLGASASAPERLEQVALTSARLIGGWFDSGMTMGVAWGTTMAAITRHLAKKPTRGSAVVQLNGSANTRTYGVEFAGEMMVRFGEAFDARLHLFPVPAFFDYAETRQAMWRERSVARVLDLQRTADIALFGVGALTGEVPSHVYSAGYLEQDDIRALTRDGVVGDVCTVFLRADGTYEDLDLNRRATGPTPAELQAVPRRVCAAAGDNKAAPLLAALRSQAVTDLVVDEITAQALVEVMSATEHAAAIR
ncbi:sugar-binding transcriptional regulator [Microbacterium lacus]|uniref:sugar-binding transcriptional regulator n=1 Tax=Microbacterium lacus TaxID=415217 RepID=UPI000C2CC6BA|nr:sugar-binding domain-containing protein [Microbacterium lacus]